MSIKGLKANGKYTFYNCLNCLSMFKDEIHWVKHICKIKDATTCECGANFCEQRHLEDHRKMHGITTYLCEICDFRASQRSTIISHKERHSEIAPKRYSKFFQCLECFLEFKNAKDLDEHRQCDIQVVEPSPSKTIPERTRLTDDKSTQYDDSSFDSEGSSNETSRDTDHLSNGQSSSSELDEDVDVPCRCKRCVAKFVSRSTGYKTIYSEDNIIECTLCDIQFAKMSSLRTHKRNVHSPLKPYICECGARFKTKHGLQKHKKLHTVRLFQCNLCLAHFASYSRLICHRKSIHDDKTPYHCTRCSHHFKYKYQLTKHEAIH